MSAFSDYIATLYTGLAGKVAYGGTLTTPTEFDEFPIAIAQQIAGNTFAVPSLEALAGIPYQILQKDMTVIVQQHARGGGEIHPRTRYTLYALPPADTKVEDVPGYSISQYWRIDNDTSEYDGTIEAQYAPNFNGKKPLFRPTEISSAAYQAGFPDDATYNGGAGDPADKIWADSFDATKNHLWLRQRLGATSPWGIPIPLGTGNYSQQGYQDTIFKWVSPKGNPAPAKPVQPDDYLSLPTGWDDTPGTNYAVDITTMDLYRSTAIKTAYGQLITDWEEPQLVSSDPQLVRYGNLPGNTDFLNDTYWRGYFIPGQDTHMATRVSAVSTDWTVSKITGESGEYVDFVFKAFPIGTDVPTLTAAIPTIPEPYGQAAPNDWEDSPPVAGTNEVVYMTKTTKYFDGSLKTNWSFPIRIDGLDFWQAVIELTNGDTFYSVRQNGDIVNVIASIIMDAKLYKGPDEVTTGITQYKWYKDGTEIIFSGVTNKATNLGAYNDFHTASPDRSQLTITPGALDDTAEYKIGIVHPSRTAEYPDTQQIRDATDDGEAFYADILPVQGTTFKDGLGSLFQFNSQFIVGGVVDNTGVTFKWSIKDAAGAPLTNGLRDNGGTPIGDTNVVAASVYVNEADITNFATLILEADLGTEVIRFDQVLLTDVTDALPMEVLFWGSGSTNPGAPTDFVDRTLTQAQVLALAIGYTTDPAQKWYMIQRIDGVWLQPVQIRGESANPAGGYVHFIFKNVDFDVDGAPSAPAIPGSGSLTPAGWTSQATAFTGLQDRRYMASAAFTLRTDITADPSQFDRDNYNPVSAQYSTPSAIEVPGGVTVPGDKGWSPVFAVIEDGETRKLQLVDWVGGSGTQPTGAGGSSSYVGATGLTTKGNAIDIRGPEGISPTIDYSTFGFQNQKFVQLGTVNTPGSTSVKETYIDVGTDANKVLLIEAWVEADNTDTNPIYNQLLSMVFYKAPGPSISFATQIFAKTYTVNPRGQVRATYVVTGVDHRYIVFRHGPAAGSANNITTSFYGLRVTRIL